MHPAPCGIVSPSCHSGLLFYQLSLEVSAWHKWRNEVWVTALMAGFWRLKSLWAGWHHFCGMCEELLKSRACRVYVVLVGTRTCSFLGCPHWAMFLHSLLTSNPLPHPKWVVFSPFAYEKPKTKSQLVWWGSEQKGWSNLKASKYCFLGGIGRQDYSIKLAYRAVLRSVWIS